MSPTQFGLVVLAAFCGALIGSYAALWIILNIVLPKDDERPK